MTTHSKKMLPMCILEILNKYTDENHRLSQKDIEKYLKKDYGLTIERKTVKRTIMDLIEVGASIQHTEKLRMVKDKKTGEIEEQSMLTDFYMERDFSDCEIRLLIDELLDAHFIPTSQRKELISKLENLSNVYFRKGSAYKNNSKEAPVNNQLFYTIEIVEEALSKGRNVRFNYQKFVTGSNGNVDLVKEEYNVTPYDTRKVNGDYLLLCSEDGINEISFRMDYISDIKITNTVGYTSKRESPSGMRTIKFISDESILSEFVKQFGKENIRVDDRGSEIELSIRAEESDAVDFALLYSGVVTVIAPEDCRRKVYNTLHSGCERYERYVS